METLINGIGITITLIVLLLTARTFVNLGKDICKIIYSCYRDRIKLRSNIKKNK